MMKPSKAEFFNTQVETSWASAEYTARELKQIGRMLDLARLGSGIKILEPGCGTGRLTRILADRVGPSGSVLAMDMSARMVEACLRNVASKAHVEVVCTAMEDYLFPRREFDAVVCHQVFPHFDNKRGVLNLFARILKPSGTLIVFHFMNSSQINKMHREAHAAVKGDMMPSEETMRKMFAFSGIGIDFLEDDENGYLLISHVGD